MTTYVVIDKNTKEETECYNLQQTYVMIELIRKKNHQYEVIVNE